MAVKWYNPTTWFRKPEKKTETATITPQKVSITPAPHSDPYRGPTITTTQPSTTTTDKTPATITGSKKGGSGGSSRSSGSSSSNSIQGPVPLGTTPQEEQTFRQTGVTTTANRIQPATTTSTNLTVEPTSASQRRKDYQDRYTLSGWEATKYSFSRLFNPSNWFESQEDKLTRARTITDTTGPKIEKPSAWRNIIEPFTMTTDRGQQIDPVQPFAVGTTPIDPSTGQQIKRTKFIATEELINPLETEMTLKGFELQQKVNTEEITVEQANEQYLKDTERTRREIQNINRRTSNLYSSPTYETLRDLPSNIETGAIVAGSFFAPQVTGAYLLGSGLFQGAKLNQKASEGYDITFGEKFSAGSRIAFGFQTFSLPSIKMAESITREYISSGQTSPPSFSRTNIFTPDSSGVRTGVSITQRGTPYYEEFSKVSFRIKPTTGTSFDIIGGTTGKTTTRYVDFLKQIRGEYKWVSSTQSFSGIGRIDLGSVGDVSASVSRGLWVDSSGKTTTTLYGGTFKPATSTETFSIQSPVKELTYYTSGRQTVSISPFDVKTFGLTRDRNLLLDDFTNSFSSGGSRSFRGSGGSGSSFSQMFNKQTIQGVNIIPPSFSISPATSKPLFPTTVITDIQSPTTTGTRPTSGFSFSPSSSQILEQRPTTENTFRPTTINLPRPDIKPSSSRGFLNIQTPTPIVDTITSSDFKQFFPTPQKTITPIINIPTPTFKPIGGGGGGFGFPPIVLPFGGDRGLGFGKMKATRTYRYTPSFKAIVFNIRGKQPKKKRFSGLEVRPIINGGWFGKKRKGFPNRLI